MPAYRLYRINGEGSFSDAQWIAADSDAEALAYARQKWPGSRYEIWERNRLVARVAQNQ